MAFAKKYISTLFMVLPLLLCFGIAPATALTTDYCGTGAAEPPFLAFGVDPNLLLLIDNSGSTLDLGYVETNSQCFDDTYDVNTIYAGYFNPNYYYIYDLTEEKFKLWSAATEDLWWNADGTDWYTKIGHVYLKMDGTLTNITAILARGKFLNWATASKIDIQKEILTGGKYEDTDNLLIMEGRGCSNQRYVKSMPLDQFYTAAGAGYSATTKTLTLAVRPARSQVFDEWENGHAYSVGDIVTDLGVLYIATTSGTSNGVGASDDTGVSWAAYIGTIWTNGATYAAGSVVSDPSKDNTVDEGTLYYTDAGGTASGTGVDDDTGVTDWEPYHLTHIEIYSITENGFDPTGCHSAVQAMSDPTGQGVVSQGIDDCMGYTSGQGSLVTNSHAAFNHSIHMCWFYAKQGSWPTTFANTDDKCEDVYNAGIDPWNIIPDDRAYVCYGSYPDAGGSFEGYIGRCWNPGTGADRQCTGGRFTSGPKAGECKRWEWVGGTSPGWDGVGAGYASDDECIETAMQEFCGSLTVPEVIDPSDIADTTSEFWNLPGMLVDSGVLAQLDEAQLVLKGRIDQSSAPTGLIQEYDNDIRMGAMVFNNDGAAAECDDSDPNILYQCTVASNRDGGKIISDIDKSDAHTTVLVNAINDIKGTSWTPLAEAMFNALGYYAQDSGTRLDSNDFNIGASYDPITHYCQNNNILIITEGASTMDKHTSVTDSSKYNDENDNDATMDCGDLNGSTYLDDLTDFAYTNFNSITSQLNGNDKENISTHIVVAGTLRVTGADECSPDVLLGEAAEKGGTDLYQASNPGELEAKLREAFESIRAGAAAGSAASVISASRGGEGATYQAIFWPRIELTGDATVDWIGEVHSLFVDSLGNLYEDTDNNRTLDTSTDEKVSFYYNESVGASKACNGTITESGTCNGTSKDLEDVNYLWSAAEWLANISPTTSADAGTDILSNRTTYISQPKKRFIFTWNDLDNDGVVDSTNGTIGTGELLHFVDSGTTGGTNWSALSVNASRGSVLLDFGVQTLAEADAIVKWVRGLDEATLRSREMPYDFDPSDANPATDVYWRLGDVVHSTPISVSSPAEGFQFLYSDDSYRQFVAAYKSRRHMIYFGGNDGMIHAINGGFYDEINTRFCRTSSCSDEGATPTNSPELGAELWAYVPYNLLPHLKCLKDVNYTHKYFVDLHPRIFDVRIFPADSVHTNGWGTILVQGMRFGGAKVLPGDLDLDNNGEADTVTAGINDTREFTSAYVVLDITDPDTPPKLLGEFTRKTDAILNHVDLAYTTAMPTLVVMTDDADTDGTIEQDETSWYLMLGSGPTTADGTSTQDAKLAVLPLNQLLSTKKFQITDVSPPGAGNESGTFTLSANSFVTDIISVDFELEEDFKTDVVYFGTISGNWGAWGGGMYRLVTRELDSNGDQNVTWPRQWGDLLNNTIVSLSNPDGLAQNNPDYLINVGQPITGAASIGFDGTNYWVYFGTGRFFDEDDKTDSGSNAQQTFYGIKEPRDCNGYTGSSKCNDCLDGGKGFTWQTVENTGTWNTTPGAQGLLQVDMIEVGLGTTGTDSVLSCQDADADCESLRTVTGITTFDGLDTYIAGTGSCFDSSDPSGARDLYETGTDGWYKDFHEARERNLGQATLLGGLLTFTTYQPFDDACLPEGLGYLYGVYFRTGTPWYQSVFDRDEEETPVSDRIDLGRGLAITPNLHVGKQEGSKAFVQTSTGTIVEIPEPNLPIKAVGTGRTSWGEIK
ncbi:MAG: hypothetical protein JSW04_01200 [Desulfobacterales bacterium]|nr:MAG: hypothetical protein JSW04_01200 [Desulfobacterales bacterium]